MSAQITIYMIYLATAIGLTWALAATLYKNGAVFLDEVFQGEPGVGRAVNNLLVTGFFMLNLGYAFLIFRSNPAATNLEAVELLVTKLGMLLGSLGLIHFVNMAIIWKVRKRASFDAAPPVPPTSFVPPPPTMTPPVLSTFAARATTE